MPEELIIKIESCRDCLGLKITLASFFIAIYIYTCTKANRDIYSNEKITPPPTWCPLREKEYNRSNKLNNSK